MVEPSIEARVAELENQLAIAGENARTLGRRLTMISDRLDKIAPPGGVAEMETPAPSPGGLSAEDARLCLEPVELTVHAEWQRHLDGEVEDATATWAALTRLQAYLGALSREPTGAPRGDAEEEESEGGGCPRCDGDPPAAELVVVGYMSHEEPPYGATLTIWHPDRRVVRADDAPSIAAALRSLADQLEPAPSPGGLSAEDAQHCIDAIGRTCAHTDEQMRAYRAGMAFLKAVAQGSEPSGGVVADLKRQAEAEPCTCGSGAHPRHCKKHPEAFKEHCDSLCAEQLGEEIVDHAEEIQGLRADLAREREARERAEKVAAAREELLEIVTDAGLRHLDKLAELHTLIRKLDPDHWHTTRGVIETLQQRLPGEESAEGQG